MPSLLFVLAQDSASSPEPLDAKFGLSVILIVLALACTAIAIFTWHSRDVFGDVLRRNPVLKFGVFVLAVICGAAAAVLLEGANPAALIGGKATPEEFRVYMCLAVIGIGAFSMAVISWSESMSAADKVSRLESDVQDAESRAESAERELLFANAVNRLYLSVVAKKTHRFLESDGQLQGMQPNGSQFIRRMHQAHSPVQQCLEIIGATWSVLELHLREQQHKSFSLRVALFCVRGDHLVVELSTDGKRQSVVKGPGRHGCKEAFQLANPVGQSLAAEVAFSQEVIIEPDATVANDLLRTSYRPRDDTHHRRIQSIVGMPLGLPDQPGIPCRRVLCIDTDIKNGFQLEHIDRLEQIRDNLEQRLLIELVQRSAYNEPSKSASNGQ